MNLEELKNKAIAKGQKDMAEIIDRFQELIERCEKAEANAIVTDNTKTLAAALERNAELEAKLSEMEKQTPIYQYQGSPGTWVDIDKELYYVLDDVYRRIVYALPVPQQSEWQDISTAPKDGKKVLLSLNNSHGKRRTIIGFWVDKYEIEDTSDDYEGGDFNERSEIYYWYQGWYENFESHDDFTVAFADQKALTHWMPLPPITK